MNLNSVDLNEIAKSIISAKTATHYGIFPLAVEDDQIQIAIAPGHRDDLKQELEVLTGKKIHFTYHESSDISRAIEREYGIGATTVESLTHKSNHFVKSKSQDNSYDIKDDNQASVTQLVNALISKAIDLGASDLHIEPFEKQFRVRVRVDGLLRKASVSSNIIQLAANIITRLKIMSELDIGEKRLAQDGRFRVQLHGEFVDIRVSVLPTTFGEGIVLRILKPLKLRYLNDLGFYPDAQTIINKHLQQPNGMILVTGPTGSGKTTTLYSCLHQLNREDYKIITIEDPVEYRMEGVLQMQVNKKIDFGFPQALRSMLRHDPDCLLIGEIRDFETANIAVSSALTGHLVLSTLHTNDAASAITRLIEMKIDPFLIASTLNLIIAQRLIRTFDAKDGSVTGRTTVYEILEMNDDLRNLVLERGNASQLRAAARRQGMLDFGQVGSEKVRMKTTTKAELSRVLGTL